MEPSPKRPKMSNGEAEEESSYIPTAEDGGGKLSIMFSLKQEAGALQKALSAFNVRVTSAPVNGGRENVYFCAGSVY